MVLAFFLLPSDPDMSFLEGQYRLNLIYRRDNREHNPGSVVLSQADDSDDEKVTVDIPWI